MPAMRRISWYSSSRDRRNNQADVLQKFHFAQRRVVAQFGQRHLPRQPFERAQVGHHAFALRVVRIGIGIAGHFRQRVKRALRRRVVAEHAVALPHQLELAQGVRARCRRRATSPCPSRRACPSDSYAGSTLNSQWLRLETGWVMDANWLIDRDLS